LYSPTRILLQEEELDITRRQCEFWHSSLSGGSKIERVTSTSEPIQRSGECVWGGE